LSNDGSINPQGQALAIADLYLAQYFKKEQLPEDRDPAIMDIAYAPALDDVRSVTGRYLEQENYYLREIVLRGDTLWYSRPEQGNRETQLLPFAKDSFLLDGTNGEVVIVFSNTAAGRSMRIVENGQRTGSFTMLGSPQLEDIEALTGRYYSESLGTHYQLVAQNNQLQVQHPAIGTIHLTPIHKDEFITDVWQFSHLKLARNAQGEVTGFRISSGRAQRILFRKV
ncbi:MAG: hypothetical protein AAF840_13505, partial [Bacteroidota bacterium]